MLVGFVQHTCYLALDLLKKKSRLLKDSHRLSELGDILFRIGYLYYHKGSVWRHVWDIT